jgi:DNA recombination protein RmuC
MEFIWLLIGIMTGIVGAGLFFRTKIRFAEMSGNERIALLNNQLNNLMFEKKQADEALLSLNRELASCEAELKFTQSKLNEQKTDIEQLQEKFRTEFKNLANEILEDKSKRFSEQNILNISQILKPLGEKIKDFEKKVDEAYDKESQQRFSLKEEVKRLAELNQQVKMEANNLVKALKGESKTQGSWGEVILEGILQQSGLTRNREYFVQESIKNDEGKRFQPDVVVNFPDGRSVVIDSKVSLTAYERFCSSESENEQTLALREHLLSVKKHVDELSGKRYQDLIGSGSLDSVMMFMPVEPAYLLAVQNDTEIWNYAWEKRVVLISPTNLIAILRIVENLWRLENQNRNAEEIARQCGALYDKFVGLADDFTEVGRLLDKSKEAYTASMNKLTTGRGNIVNRLEGIRKLGARTSKNLPPQMLDKLDDEDNRISE